MTRKQLSSRALGRTSFRLNLGVLRSDTTASTLGLTSTSWKGGDRGDGQDHRHHHPSTPVKREGHVPGEPWRLPAWSCTNRERKGLPVTGGLWVISLPLPAGTRFLGRVPFKAPHPSLTQRLLFSIFGKMTAGGRPGQGRGGGILAVLTQARPPPHKAAWAEETVLRDSETSTAHKECDKGPSRGSYYEEAWVHGTRAGRVFGSKLGVFL